MIELKATGDKNRLKNGLGHEDTRFDDSSRGNENDQNKLLASTKKEKEKQRRQAATLDLDELEELGDDWEKNEKEY